MTILLVVRCKRHGGVLSKVGDGPTRGEPIMAMRCKQCTHPIDLWDHREKHGDIVMIAWSEVAGLIAKARKSGKTMTYNLPDPGNTPDGPGEYQMGVGPL